MSGFNGLAREPKEWFAGASVPVLIFPFCDPDWVMHAVIESCPTEAPHRVSECGEMTAENAEGGES